MFTLTLTALSMVALVTACGKKDEGGGGTVAQPNPQLAMQCAQQGAAYSPSYPSQCLQIGHCAQQGPNFAMAPTGQCVAVTPAYGYGAGGYGQQCGTGYGCQYPTQYPTQYPVQYPVQYPQQWGGYPAYQYGVPTYVPVAPSPSFYMGVRF